MIKVTINNKSQEVKEGTPLKSLLNDLSFPCDGKGICGKCKIIAPAIEPTYKDKKFFSEKQIEEGARIACDKIILNECKIDYSPLQQENNNVKKLEQCSIFAYLGIQGMTIGILDDELIEVKQFIYEEDDILNPLFARQIKSKLSHISIELFEKYSVAKSHTMLISGNAEIVNSIKGLDPLVMHNLDYKDKAFNSHFESGTLYDLPTEDVYFLPSINGYLGSDIIASLYYLTENSLFVDLSNTAVIGKLDKDNYLLTPFNGIYGKDLLFDLKNDNASLNIRAFKAGVEYMLSNEIKSVIYKGTEKWAMEKLFPSISLHCLDDGVIDFVKSATLNLRYRTYADKIRRKTNILDLKTENCWQDIFSNIDLN